MKKTKNGMDIADKVSTEVAVRPEGQVMAAPGRGMDDVDNADLIIPRVKLMQPLSPELKECRDLRAGMIINSLTKEELPAVFTPIFYWKEWMRFNPRDEDKPGYDKELEPGQMMWRTRDASDERVKQAEFGPNGETPLAMSVLNFFSVFEETGMPVILSFTKTSYKAGKNLLSLAKLRGGDMFGRKYKLTVKEESNAKGDYYVLVINPAGDCASDEYKLGEAYFQQFGIKRDFKDHAEAVSE